MAPENSKLIQKERLRELQIIHKKNQEKNFASSNLTTSHLIFDIDNLDRDKLDKILENRWDDPQVSKSMQEIFAGLEILAEKIGTPLVYRHYLKILRILGKGVQGIVSGAEISAGVGGHLPAIAIKNIENVKDVVEKDALLREFFVGMQLNKLQRVTPIFSKTYGMSNCSKLFTQTIPVDRRKKRDPVSFCANGEGITIINQFINGGQIGDSAKILTPDEFYRIYLILLFGLKEAEIYGFTDFDMHTGNVLLQDLKETMQFPLIWKDKKYLVKSRKVPKIIDYGLSRIETVVGTIYPTAPDWVTDNGIVDKYVPLHDIYKFILYYLLETESRFNSLKWLGEFFYPRGLTQNFVRTLWEKTNFVLPMEWQGGKLDDYIEYVLSRIPKGIISDQIGPEHEFAVYRDSFDFFSEIGISLEKYGNLRDSYQWYVYSSIGDKKGTGKQLLTELKTVLPDQLIRFENFLDETLTLLPKSQQEILTEDTEGQIVILGAVGDRALSIAEEKKVLNLALKDTGAEPNEWLKIITQKIELIQRYLQPFQLLYDKYKMILANLKPEDVANFESIAPPVI